MAGGGFVLPIGTDGWTLNPEYTYSYTRPRASGGEPESTGRFQRVALRTSYPLIRSRAQTLLADASLEHIEQVMTATDFGVDLSRDRYYVARAGATLDSSLPWGAPDFAPTATPMPAAEPPRASTWKLHANSRMKRGRRGGASM